MTGAIIIAKLEGKIDGNVIIKTEVEKYEGEYEVYPDVFDISLKTQEKMLTNNVTVKAVPLHEVSNAAGGKTLTIGGR